MQTTSRRWPLLLATDLDNTLVGDARGLSAFLRWLLPRRANWLLVYATGRGWDSAWNLVRTAGLTFPDALITDVGTSIHITTRQPPVSLLHYRLDRDWDAALAARWQGEQVDALVAEVPGLCPQSGVAARLRRSYWVEQPDAVAQLQAGLETAGLSVRHVFSSGRDLDLLPAGAGKGAALGHLVQTWQIPAWRVITCGDSGNDLDMLTQGYSGVVVGNATPELAQADLPAAVYRAHKAHAWGVLEGLHRWLGHRRSA